MLTLRPEDPLLVALTYEKTAETSCLLAMKRQNRRTYALERVTIGMSHELAAELASFVKG
jgi:hypothetical protein